MGTGSQQIEQNYTQTTKNEAARGAPPDHPEGRGWGAETEGGLSTPGPIGEPVRGFGTAAENMALPLSWEQGCDSGLMSQDGHLPPSTRPGEARNAGRQLEERRQAHEGEREGV